MIKLEDFPQEDVRPVKGYEGLYCVTRCGKVFSQFWTKYPAKLLKEQRIRPNGNRHYPTVALTTNYKRVNKSIHRLVCQAFDGDPEGDRCEVNHIDGVTSNPHASNLEWVTRAGNIQHAIRTGLTKIKHGESNRWAKLTADSVVKMREERRGGALYADIGAKYDCSPHNVSLICRRIRWKHVA